MRARPRGRPRKTWLEMVKNDMKGLGLSTGYPDLPDIRPDIRYPVDYTIRFSTTVKVKSLDSEFFINGIQST